MDRKRGTRSHSPQHKRQKVTHDTACPPASTSDADDAKKTGTGPCAENLVAGLLSEENVERLRKEYADSEPYKYARVETLFQDDLLRKVKDECTAHLSFTEKETDIYRVSPIAVFTFVCVPRAARSRFSLFFLTSASTSLPRTRHSLQLNANALIPPSFSSFFPTKSTTVSDPNRSTKPETSLPSITSPNSRSLFSPTSSPSATPCTLKSSVHSYARSQDVVPSLARNKTCP